MVAFGALFHVFINGRPLVLAVGPKWRLLMSFQRTSTIISGSTLYIPLDWSRSLWPNTASQCKYFLFDSWYWTILTDANYHLSYLDHFSNPPNYGRDVAEFQYQSIIELLPWLLHVCTLFRLMLYHQAFLLWFFWQSIPGSLHIILRSPAKKQRAR